LLAAAMMLCFPAGWAGQRATPPGLGSLLLRREVGIGVPPLAGDGAMRLQGGARQRGVGAVGEVEFSKQWHLPRRLAHCAGMTGSADKQAGTHRTKRNLHSSPIHAAGALPRKRQAEHVHKAYWLHSSAPAVACKPAQRSWRGSHARLPTCACRFSILMLALKPRAARPTMALQAAGQSVRQGWHDKWGRGLGLGCASSAEHTNQTNCCFMSLQCKNAKQQVAACRLC